MLKQKEKKLKLDFDAILGGRATSWIQRRNDNRELSGVDLYVEIGRIKKWRKWCLKILIKSLHLSSNASQMT